MNAPTSLRAFLEHEGIGGDHDAIEAQGLTLQSTPTECEDKLKNAGLSLSRRMQIQTALWPQVPSSPKQWPNSQAIETLPRIGGRDSSREAILAELLASVPVSETVSTAITPLETPSLLTPSGSSLDLWLQRHTHENDYIAQLDTITSAVQSTRTTLHPPHDESRNSFEIPHMLKGAGLNAWLELERLDPRGAMPVGSPTPPCANATRPTRVSPLQIARTRTFSEGSQSPRTALASRVIGNSLPTSPRAEYPGRVLGSSASNDDHAPPPYTLECDFNAASRVAAPPFADPADGKTSIDSADDTTGGAVVVADTDTPAFAPPNVLDTLMDAAAKLVEQSPTDESKAMTGSTAEAELGAGAGAGAAAGAEAARAGIWGSPASVTRLIMK